MKRNPRKVRWTKAFRKAHKKDLTVDATLEFEQRRNRPIKYNREKMHKTLLAMQRIAEIREKRERQHHINRLKGDKKRQLQVDLKDLKENLHLVEFPRSLIEAQDRRIKEKNQQQKTHDLNEQ